MKLFKKHNFLVLISFISIVIIVSILLSFNSFSNINKLKGDVSNFTPQANYNLSTTDNVDSTTWVAVDNLGRTVSTSGETYRNGVTNTNMTVGTSINDSKQVGLFYHNWHNVVRHNMNVPETISKRMEYIVSQGLDPLSLKSWEVTAGKDGHPGFGSYWWGEPVYGFYNPLDKYVIRRHIELISDAGVDFIVLDYTNYNHINEYSPYCSDSVCSSTCSCLRTCNQTYPNDKTARNNCRDNCTNNEPVSCTLINSVYRDELNVLFQVLDEAEADGIKTPKVTFMLSHFACDRSKPSCSNHTQSIENNNNTKVMVQWLYDNVYTNSSIQKNHLLYGAGDKPIILAQHPSPNTWQADSSHSVITETYAHWRYMGNQYENATYNTSGYDWTWLDKYPQTKYGYNTDSETTNFISVSAAQHTTPEQGVGPVAYSQALTYNKNILGRSNAVDETAECNGCSSCYCYTYKYRNIDYSVNRYFQIEPNLGVGTLYGRNFQQQWDYAIANNPQFVFVASWNHYLAGSEEDEAGKIHFIDTFTDEYSMDLEPSSETLKDSYYYQLVSNIRRFKGANVQTAQSTSKTINIYGDPNQWNDSNLIDYNSYTNIHSPNRSVNNNNLEWGYGNRNINSSKPVINDIRTTKVSYDASNIYFYVETVNNITDISKLRLLIDTLPSKTNTSDKNWNEFEYVLNRNGATENTLKLEKASNNCRNDANPSYTTKTCTWSNVGNVNYQIVSNTLQVSIPRNYLGLTDTNDGHFTFNYKWADNNLNNADYGEHEDLTRMYDIMSIYTDGDAAPGGRFAYKFSGNKAYSPAAQYTITYNANGGTGSVSSQSGELNTKVTLRDNGYTYGSRVFKNWNTKADGTGTSYGAGETVLFTGNITLYAQWEIPLVTKPTISGETSFIYNGSEQGIIVENVDTSKVNISGYTSKINSGNYQVTYSLKNKNDTTWSDGTTTDVTFNWSIEKIKLTKPAISGSNTFTYTGGYQGLTFNDIDDNVMTISGNNHIDVGSYTTTIGLSDLNNYTWEDGTSTGLLFTWSITKADINPTVYMADYYKNDTPSIPIVTGNLGNGTVTYSYAAKDSDNYSNNPPTKVGEYKVKAVIAATANYNGATVTSNFKVLNVEPETIVLPDGSIVKDVGVYGALIDSYNREKGTDYDYTHLFTEEELASLHTLSITEEEYHNVSVNNLDDIKYLTSLETLNINLWDNCGCEKLDLHLNTDLQTLTVKNSPIEIINISNLNLTSIDLDIPNGTGYLITNIGHETSYIKNINDSGQYLITNPSTTTEATGLICTNYIVNIAGDGLYKPTYNIVVLGDVKSDGMINVQDISKAYSGLSKNIYINYSNAEKMALDITNDDRKNALDLLRIYSLIETSD